MKKLKRCWMMILLLGILLSHGISVYASTEELPSGVKDDLLGSIVEEYVQEHEDTTAGMAVSVFRQEESIYTNYFGYADKEAEIVVDKDTVIEWGSATKLLVWVSVMQLWEQGQIDLNTDVSTYLPEGFLTNLNYDIPITMINLMNHNAGFQDLYADLFVKERDAIGKLEDTLKAHMPEQIYEPGTVTAYSNWGVALAAYVVEQISGKSFDDYVHQYIFEPLNMEHSALSADLSDNTWVQEKRKELQCYTADGTLLPDCFYYISLYPAGMCTSTLSDFETFGKALLNEESSLFQNIGTWEMLFTPTGYLGDGDVVSNYHGFWVVPYGVETIGHGGNTAGCSSYLLLDLQNDVGAVVMTNQQNEMIYNSEMMELIFGKYSAQNYFEIERTIPEGIYRPARTVRMGPFKIMSLSFMSGDEVGEDEFWMTGTSSGVEKICYPYADFIRVPAWQFFLEIILAILWIVALLFSVVSLLVKVIIKIINIKKKRTCESPLSKWNTVTAITQIMVILLCVVVAFKAMNYALFSTYVWAIVACGVIAVIMVALILYGIATMRKTETNKKTKCYNWVTVILALTTVSNIIYWNLFMWWKL